MNRIFSFGLAMTLAAVASAQTAYDEANYPPYTVGSEYIQVGTPPGDQTAATNGMNGGFGFERWQRGGYGDPPNNGTTLTTNLPGTFNMGTQQWGMRSGPGGVEGADARRRMVNDLPVGGTMRFSMMAGGAGAGTENTQGIFGVEIRSSSLSTNRDIFQIFGQPGDNWFLYGLQGDVPTGLPVVPGQRLDVAITPFGANSFKVSLTPFGSSTSSFSVDSISFGQLIRTAQFYVFNTDGDFYLNYLSVNHDPVHDIVAPKSFTVGLGKISSGTVASLGATDGNALTVCKFIVPNQLVAPITVQIDGKSTLGVCSALSLEFVSRMSVSGLFGLTLDLFNWTTNDWDATNTLSTSLSPNYAQATLNATGTLSNYLKADGSLRARYRVRQTGPAASTAWCHDTDRATWVVTP